MTPQLIKKLFPDYDQKELSQLWQTIYSPELSSIFGKPTVDVMELDRMLIARYGQYESSMKDFIGDKFGAEILEEFKQCLDLE